MFKKKNTHQVSKQESIETTNDFEADYDGYYDDRIPEDAGVEYTSQNRNLARQLIPLAIGFLIIIAASIAVLYLS